MIARVIQALLALLLFIVAGAIVNEILGASVTSGIKDVLTVVFLTAAAVDIIIIVILILKGK